MGSERERFRSEDGTSRSGGGKEVAVLLCGGGRITVQELLADIRVGFELVLVIVVM